MATAASAENINQSWGDGACPERLTGAKESNGRLARPKAPAPNPRTQITARQPLLYAALAFAIGLYAGKYAWRPSSWWVIAAIVFICSAIYFLHRRDWAALALCFGAIFFAGALTMQARGTRAPVLAFVNTELAVTAHVTAEGELQQEAPDSFRQKIDIETESLALDSQSQPASAGVRLNIYSERQHMPLLHYGQRIRFSGTLVPPRNFRNPGAFDYAGYLCEKGISAAASVKYSNLEFLPGFAGSHIEQARERIHRSIIAKIHQLWPEQEAGLMDAIVIGEDTFIERPTRVDFQRSGTYHVLVVSGMNVSILALFTVWFLRRTGLGQIASSTVAIVLILSYAAITNIGPPVWRAALMFVVYLATRLLYRDRAMLNALGAAALALLIFDPQSLFGASFQMTFLCVGLVASIGLPLLERTVEPYSRGLQNLNSFAYDRHLAPKVAQFRLDLRLLLGRLQQILPARVSIRGLILSFRFSFVFTELVVMSAIMQFGLALPMAYYFHRATSVAMPANLLIIPFLQLLMPAAVIAISLGYISLTLAKVPAVIAGFALQGITGTVQWLGGLRLADIRVPTPHVAAVILCLIAIAACAVLIRKQRKFAIAGAAVLAASTMWIWFFPPPPRLHPGALEMTAIDVGQGDSIFFALPDGKTLLVDAGGLPFWTHSRMEIGEDVVSPYLWSRAISHIDAVALTHAHADHMGGVPAVIANFHPCELWLPVAIHQEEVRDLLKTAYQFGVKVRYWKTGDDFSFGGARFRVLAPAWGAGEESNEKRRNDESLVLKLTLGQTSALLEADAERPTERLLTNEDPSADVLKIAHHGSASSTNDYLLQAVHPKFAVISVGSRNVYHHPRAEVLSRLQRARVLTYRTDLDGAISFFLDGKTVTTRIATLP